MQTQTDTTTKASAQPDNVREVSESDWNEAVAIAQDRVKLGRLRAYLRPKLAQEAKNIASAAANSISDFEAMKRGKAMLERIENESE